MGGCIGTPNTFDTIVSRQGDIIYDLQFPIELQHSVKLNITYRTEDGRTSSRIPDDSYDNTRRIIYSEIRRPSEVYYVRIALISMDGTISGPLTESLEIG